MDEVGGEMAGIQRQVGTRDMPSGPGHTVRLRGVYGAPIEDVWDACTNPDRIRRWFVPVSGDLRLGGRFQLEGHAGGVVLRCDAPHGLTVSWGGGEAAPEDGSRVELRLSRGTGGATVLELEHVAVVDPAFWAKYGPGSVGVGWDLAVGLGLAKHLRGEGTEEGPKWLRTPAGRALIGESCRAWGLAHRASGALPEDVEKAVKETTAFYAGGAG